MERIETSNKKNIFDEEELRILISPKDFAVFIQHCLVEYGIIDTKMLDRCEIAELIENKGKQAEEKENLIKVIELLMNDSYAFEDIALNFTIAHHLYEKKIINDKLLYLLNTL